MDAPLLAELPLGGVPDLVPRGSGLEFLLRVRAPAGGPARACRAWPGPIPAATRSARSRRGGPPCCSPPRARSRPRPGTSPLPRSSPTTPRASPWPGRPAGPETTAPGRPRRRTSGGPKRSRNGGRATARSSPPRRGRSAPPRKAPSARPETVPASSLPPNPHLSARPPGAPSDRSAERRAIRPPTSWARQPASVSGCRPAVPRGAAAAARPGGSRPARGPRCSGRTFWRKRRKWAAVT